MLILLTEGRAVLLTEDAIVAGVTRTAVLLDGSSVCPDWVADNPPGAGEAFSLVTRSTSVTATEDRKQQQFGTTIFKNPPFKNKVCNENLTQTGGSH